MESANRSGSEIANRGSRNGGGSPQTSAPPRSRVDIFRKDGSRAGYGTIDRNGSIDVFDKAGNRKGYGKTNRDGSIQFYDTDWQRTFELRER